MSVETRMEAATRRLNRVSPGDLTPVEAREVASDLRAAGGHVLFVDTDTMAASDPMTVVGPHPRDSDVTAVHCRFQTYGLDHRRAREAIRVPTEAPAAFSQLATIGHPTAVAYEDVPQAWRDTLPQPGGWS